MTPKFHEPTTSVVEVASTALLSALRWKLESEPCACTQEDIDNFECCGPCHNRTMLKYFLADAENDSGLHGYLVRQFEEVFSDNSQDMEP